MSKTYKEAIAKGWKTRKKKYTKKEISEMMKKVSHARFKKGYKQEENV